MSSPSLDQLKRAIAVKEQIAKLEEELASILGGSAAPAAKRGRPGRKPGSGAAAAGAPAPKKAKRVMSAEGRARIIAAQKARWAKIKKEKSK